MGQMLAIEYLNAEDMVEGNCGFALQDRTYVLVGGGGGCGGVARTEVDCLSVWALGNYPCSQEKPGASP